MHKEWPAQLGRTDILVVKKLLDEPYRFGFFQAVRLLERIYKGHRPVGRDGDILREVIRFRTRATLGFPASEIHDLTWPDPERYNVPEMTVDFMGLTGPLGVLPIHYTEFLMERLRAKD